MTNVTNVNNTTFVETVLKYRSTVVCICIVVSITLESIKEDVNTKYLIIEKIVHKEGVSSDDFMDLVLCPY